LFFGGVVGISVVKRGLVLVCVGYRKIGATTHRHNTSITSNIPPARAPRPPPNAPAPGTSPYWA
jgi:hypothetical protein